MAKPRIKCRYQKRANKENTDLSSIRTVLCLSASTASGGFSQFESSPLVSSCSDQNPSPSLSISSSAFSSDSQRARAHLHMQQHKQELREIRGQSRLVQKFLKEKLRRTNMNGGLDYYARELEGLRVKAERKDTDVAVRKLKMELRRRELESEELKETVNRLERTVLDLGGSVSLGKTTLETDQNQSFCATSCQLM